MGSQLQGRGRKQLLKKSSRLSPLLLISVILLGLSFVFLVPPFQNPDEVKHLGACLFWALPEQKSPEMIAFWEARVVEEMKESRWFRFVGMGEAPARMKRVSQLPYLFCSSLQEPDNRNTLYHRVGGGLLRLFTLDHRPLTFLYILRLSSWLFLSLATTLYWLWCRRREEGLFLFLGLSLIPQWVMISTSVSYDAVLGGLSLLFFLGARELVESGRWWLFPLLAVPAALAPFVKLSGGLFLALFLGFAWLFAPYSLKERLRTVGALCLASPLLFWAAYRGSYLSALQSKVSDWFNGGTVRPDGWLLDYVQWASYWDVLGESLLFKAGWMHHSLSLFWYTPLLLLFLAAMTGLFLLWGGKMLEEREERVVLFHLLCLGSLLTLSLLWSGQHGIFVQGRLLFPVLLPLVSLVNHGLRLWERRLEMKRPWLRGFALLFLSLFFMAAIFKLLGVYYGELSAPLPGL